MLRKYNNIYKNLFRRVYTYDVIETIYQRQTYLWYFYLSNLEWGKNKNVSTFIDFQSKLPCRQIKDIMSFVSRITTHKTPLRKTGLSQYGIGVHNNCNISYDIGNMIDDNIPNQRLQSFFFMVFMHLILTKL